jgi:hypothetical protein
MSRLQEPEIIEAIQTAAQQYGVKALAAALDMAPSTLYQKLNPYGDRTIAKLSLEESVEIMRITGNYDALVTMAGNLGFSVDAVGKDPINENTAYPALSHAMSTLGELASALKKDMGDNRLTTREKLDLFSKAVDAYDSLGPFLALGATSQNRTK